MAVLMKLDEVPARERYEGNPGWVTRLFLDKNGAVRDSKNFRVLLQDVKAGSVPHDKTLHYHRKQETLFFILSGRCVVNVQGNEYELEPNSALWIPPREKHGLTKVLEDIKMLEVLSNPNLSDRVESKQPWHQEYPGG